MNQPGPKLTLEPEPRNVAVARSFVAAGLAVLDVDDATCDKARLVTSELVTQLLSTPGDNDIVVLVLPDGPAVRVEAVSRVPAIPDDVLQIIDALSGIVVETGDTHWTITFERL